ncbi:DUF4402 domain-containing protein [Novosphingobium sp. FSY-8]|uniref:DUF4402 domain-containing protein n=1 Tax=Novosphingobium ovatum TaxID=1908523 RepID=A0ABW9XEE6_9SPHN|nr:DUF4402 domain-containing protein [Novosphingobium ovatum]NBC36918.1 DUF4402 domain-containing protein [Novosphingobium ovatum]
MSTTLALPLTHSPANGGGTGVRRALLLAAASLALSPQLARAGTPSLIVTADQMLTFGTIVAVGTGSRTIHPDGAVDNEGVVPLGDSTARPAQFTITYDSGNTTGGGYQLMVQLVLAAVDIGAVNGVRGTLTNFRTDIAGVGTLQPGNIGSFTLANCYARVCTTSFRVGARLDLSGNLASAPLRFPLPLAVNVIEMAN